MSEPEPLAKSSEVPVFLGEHLREATEYVRAVALAYAPWWEMLLGQELATKLKRALIIAATTHDLGKAAEGFQRELQDPKFRWDFRHEVLSAAILLAALGDEDVSAWAAVAVLTHHRDLNHPELSQACGVTALPDPEIVRVVQEKFRQKVHELKRFWPWLANFWKSHEELRHASFPESFENLPLPSLFLGRQMEKLAVADSVKSREQLILLLTRGWLMAADHAVSAGIKRFLSQIPSPTLPPLRPFQREVGCHDGHAFVEAPTGSGKTYAALSWSLRNRKGGERIFYLLPYQASIEAMADTLQNLFGKACVATLHARVFDYAFRRHFETTGDYEEAIRRTKVESELNRLVHKPIKVTTPFQLLKWLFGVPRFEIGVSEMVGGLFVFDEIHAYDAHVVGLICAMVEFLKDIGGRFLFMSATFPPFLKELLQKTLGEAVETFELSAKTDSLWARDFLTKARHILRWHDTSLEDMVPSIVTMLRQGKRVLVVANRVAQAQEIYRRMREQCDGVHLLHSRLTHKDRVSRESAIVGALKGKRPDVTVRALVATQVVEVSLDVSFDVIFTEVAPVDDLLQRFGRVNRYGEHEEGVEVHVALRYDRERLRYVYNEEWISKTIECAPQDGERLTVLETCEWVRKVYRSGWTEKERERYERAREAFEGILSILRPLTHLEKGLEEFYGLFQSVEILPRKLYEEYDTYIRNGYYLLANQLLVPVPLGTFYMLNNKGRLVRLKHGVLMADVIYDETLGLLPHEVDIDAAFL
ncbi:MAG: CRISPR-associated helicase Cas3' [Candidatus Caldatribacterium sp.]|uniref:CRISPR-associated helicase Cas3' n=1 Tax=Candidatus Caldatribacterium sp. TaxID=2282143 RepID=UPI002997E30A|nr:CRISPR-associated helicase Cas3' [Candidatus Caldatribacterium sp.]MCX7729833.1 CRISPR-associated helicase Cas3' [Candidatus Caldatribacterium sp.]MDW8082122.1 CRISPR-associated helicase Cas3' [Candidatus Calescibacterium sp.]